MGSVPSHAVWFHDGVKPGLAHRQVVPAPLARSWKEALEMRYRIAFLSMLVMGLAALAHPQTVVAEEAQVADCGQGAMEEQVACLKPEGRRARD
jgi:hypothetical protein